MQPDCGCREQQSRARQTGSHQPISDIVIGPVEVCDLLCADVVVDNGKQSVVYHICIPVNCHIE